MLLREGIPWADIKIMSDNEVHILAAIFIEMNKARQDIAVSQV